jgi:hypothetical protein
MKFPAAFCLTLLIPSTALWAQTAAPEPIPQPDLDERYAELTHWLAAYHEWEAWTLKWGNKVAYNAAGGMIKKRPVRPQPPEWLWEDCRVLLAADGKLGEACQVLANWDDLSPLILNRSHVGGMTATDVPVKSSFLQRIHLSGGWVPAQMPAPKVYLVAGMQVGIVEVGRATLPAIGVGLIALNDGSGGYEWKPATVIGIGYRLASFPFPAVKRQANLHVNIARATIHGMRSMPVGIDPSQNLVGFSLTFNKAR